MQREARDPKQERSRLIDHFKRAYQIVVGLAITHACLKVLPNGLQLFPDLAFWLFCTFFITVVPIFHGGDRSLDIKYLGAQPTGFWQQASYIWDVYILLITAILFVKIAQSIPGPSVNTINAAATSGPSPPKPEEFYWWMMAMLVFDVAALAIDGTKSWLLGTQGWQEIRSYPGWIIINGILAAICWYAASHPMSLAEWSPEYLGAVVFSCAFCRTVLDYIFGRRFMFP
jgi:hypothetical protein